MVVLDTHQVQEPVVSARLRSLLGGAMLRHLGRKPLPAAWLRHWRTGEVETPQPANAGKSSQFALWREQLITRHSGFKPAGPIESLRPCMMPLLAARVVGQFNDEARRVSYFDDHDLAVSFFFS
ncbi:hypothetical protein, partial [Lysobacter sp. A3-1-A15]|uniref:hypothetical protein n=1 Tax=Novilysobacter viscosus TaxID=3098602 RepID=UPI002EDA84C9